MAVPLATAFPSATAWIATSESQPAVGQHVLVSYFTWEDSTKPRGYTVACRDEFNNWFLSVPNPDYSNIYPPTHWQPFASIVDTTDLKSP